MEAWFEKYDFEMSPFSPKTVHLREELIGYESQTQEALKLVREGNMIVLQGNYGQGKTTFVRKIINAHTGSKKVAYFAANRLTKKIDTDKIVFERFGTFGKIFKIKTKNMILLIDEAHYLSSSDITKIYDGYSDGLFKSVVFVTTDKERLQLSAKVKKAIHHVITLEGPSVEQIQEIVSSRVEDKLPQINDKVISYIYERSEGKVRSILIMLDKVAQFIVENDRKKITKRDLDKIFA